MAVRVAFASLLASTSLSGPTRVGAHYLVWTGNARNPYSIRTSGHYLIATAASRSPHPERMAGHYLVTTAHAHNALWLLFLETKRRIFGITSFDYELTAGVIPEHNPYRPTIPESLIELGPDYYDYAKENQEILREQHNLTQAGDTTFPYQLVMDIHDIKHYNLGSIGRFYHEDYGVILARYVMFDEMVEVTTPHCPVGLFSTKKIDKLDWRVTNDLSKSGPDLVAGINACFVLPDNGKYGWVIIDGPILQQVKNDSTTQAIGEAFAWSATGSVSNTAAGKVIGRRVNKHKTDLSIRAGQMWVRLESASEGKIRAIIEDATQELQAAVEALQIQVGELPEAAQLQAISEELTRVANALVIETSARKAADYAIQEQLSGLNFVTQEQLDAAVEAAANNLTNAVNAIQIQLDEIRAIAVEALDKANQALSINVTALQEQISNILVMMEAERIRPKGKFPLVDGSVPPNLMYLDDGSLVYLETF